MSATTDTAGGTSARDGGKIRAWHWAAAALMAFSLLAATWLTPRTTWYERLGRPDYQALVPTAFGDWVLAPATGYEFLVPAQTDALNEIYSQIVARTYIHQPTGRRIMLSLAYGDVQQGVRQLHRPESCYSSQGFNVGDPRPDQATVDGRNLDLFRLSAVAHERTEQVTYWIRIGDRIIMGPANDLNFTRMAMGLHGIIADGLLFRVSEIARDPADSDRLQDRFIGDLLAAVGPSHLSAFVGAPTS